MFSRRCRGEPRAGVGPFAEGGGAGESQCLGGLVDRQPGEEPEAGHVGRGGVLRGESGQGGVDVEERCRGRRRSRDRLRRWRTAGHGRRAWRRVCDGRDRPGCAAWRRPRHGGTRCGRRTPRRRGGGRLRARAPWRRAYARPARPPAWPRRAGGARRRPAGRNRPSGGDSLMGSPLPASGPRPRATSPSRPSTSWHRRACSSPPPAR